MTGAVENGIPGLVMLARFVPLGVREPELDTGEDAATVHRIRTRTDTRP